MYRNKKDTSSIFNTHESNGTTGLSEASMFVSPTKKGNLESIPAIGNKVRNFEDNLYLE